MSKLLRALLIAAAAAGPTIYPTAGGLAQTDELVQKAMKELGITPERFNKIVEEGGLETCLFGTATYSWEQPIIECTDAIKSVKYRGKELAVLFYERAGVHYSKSDYEHAVRDYDEAIRLDPAFPLALYERGFAKRAIGDNAGGSADIARASELWPEIRRLLPANSTCPVPGGSFMLTDADFKILERDGMTKEKFALLPQTSKAWKTVCETRKVERVVSGKLNDCALDPYKYWVVQYLTNVERDKVVKVQINKTAALMVGEKPKCK
jgi:tetratricopeptide (TPR) repeat protein